MRGSLKGKINCCLSPQDVFSGLLIIPVSPVWALPSSNPSVVVQTMAVSPPPAIKRSLRNSRNRANKRANSLAPLSQSPIIFGSVTFLSLVWYACLITTNDLPSNTCWEPTFLYVQCHHVRSPTSPTGTCPVSGTEDNKSPSHHHRSVLKDCTIFGHPFPPGTTNVQHSTLLASSSSVVTMFLRDRLLHFSLLVWVKVALVCTWPTI